jgi:hypothetical protein
MLNTLFILRSLLPTVLFCKRFQKATEATREHSVQTSDMFHAARNRRQKIIEVVRDTAGQACRWLPFLPLKQGFFRFLDSIWASRLSVRYRVIFANPISFPSASRTGSTTTCALAILERLPGFADARHSDSTR